MPFPVRQNLIIFFKKKHHVLFFPPCPVFEQKLNYSLIDALYVKWSRISQICLVSALFSDQRELDDKKIVHFCAAVTPWTERQQHKKESFFLITQSRRLFRVRKHNGPFFLSFFPYSPAWLLIALRVFGNSARTERKTFEIQKKKLKGKEMRVVTFSFASVQKCTCSHTQAITRREITTATHFHFFAFSPNYAGSCFWRIHRCLLSLPQWWWAITISPPSLSNLGYCAAARGEVGDDRKPAAKCQGE